MSSLFFRFPFYTKHVELRQDYRSARGGGAGKTGINRKIFSLHIEKGLGRHQALEGTRLTCGRVLE
jgi:hypothetical protein